MDDLNRHEKEKRPLQEDILHTKAIKAGKRIYYLDVKKNRNNDLFLSITESKKTVSGSTENPIVQFEKHKIFLYKEDFEKFANGLNEMLAYIREHQADEMTEAENVTPFQSEQETEDALREIELSIGNIE